MDAIFATLGLLFPHHQSPEPTMSVLEVDAAGIKRMATYGFAIRSALLQQMKKEAGMRVVPFKHKGFWKIMMAGDAQFAARLQYQQNGGEPLRLLGRVHEGMQLIVYRTKNSWKLAMARDVRFAERLQAVATTEPIRLLGEMHEMMKVVVHKTKNLWKFAMAHDNCFASRLQAPSTKKPMHLLGQVHEFMKVISYKPKGLWKINMTHDTSFASRLLTPSTAEPIRLLGPCHDLMKVILYKPKSLWKLNLARDTRFPKRLQYPTAPAPFVPAPASKTACPTSLPLPQAWFLPYCNKAEIFVPHGSDTFGSTSSANYHLGMEERLQPILNDYKENFIPDNALVTPGFRDSGCDSSNCRQKEGAYDYFTCTLTDPHCRLCGAHADACRIGYGAVVPELIRFAWIECIQKKMLYARVRNLLRKSMSRFLVKKVEKFAILLQSSSERLAAKKIPPGFNSSSESSTDSSTLSSSSHTSGDSKHEKDQLISKTATSPSTWRELVPSRNWKHYKDFWGDNAEFAQ